MTCHYKRKNTISLRENYYKSFKGKIIIKVSNVKYKLSRQRLVSMENQKCPHDRPFLFKTQTSVV